MAKAELKTKPTTGSVADFLATLKDEAQRTDSEALIALMQELSGMPPKVWGNGLIGFGETVLKYASGRELDWFRCGFAPRKGMLSIYLSCDIKQHQALLDRLGKHKTGVGCLYVKRLSDVDMKVLGELVSAGGWE